MNCKVSNSPSPFLRNLLEKVHNRVYTQGDKRKINSLILNESQNQEQSFTSQYKTILLRRRYLYCMYYNFLRTHNLFFKNYSMILK